MKNKKPTKAEAAAFGKKFASAMADSINATATSPVENLDDIKAAAEAQTKK